MKFKLHGDRITDAKMQMLILFANLQLFSYTVHAIFTHLGGWICNWMGKNTKICA